jgi:hypothetical protein
MNLGYLSASITSTQIKGALRSESSQSTLDLPWEAKAVYSAKEVGAVGTDSLYVVNTKDEMYRVKFEGGGQFDIQAVQNPLGKIQQLALFNGDLLGVDTKGEVVVNDGQGQWQPYAPLQGLTVSRMTRPFMWDQYFEDQGSNLIR